MMVWPLQDTLDELNDWRTKAHVEAQHRSMLQVEIAALKAERDRLTIIADAIQAERDKWRKSAEELSEQINGWIKQAANMEADRDDLRRFVEWVAREYVEEVAGKEARRVLGDLAMHRRNSG